MATKMEVLRGLRSHLLTHWSEANEWTEKVYSAGGSGCFLAFASVMGWISRGEQVSGISPASPAHIAYAALICGGRTGALKALDREIAVEQERDLTGVPSLPTSQTVPLSSASPVQLSGQCSSMHLLSPELSG